MKPLFNLQAFLAVLTILIVSTALLVAYFRDESPAGTGHEHGKMADNDAESKRKPSVDGHAAMGHGQSSKSQAAQLKSQEPAGKSQQATGKSKMASGHGSMAHDQMSEPAAEQLPPKPEQMPERTGAGATHGRLNTPASSALPGIPGLSRLYHIGARGFFLNHAEHIALTIKQQAALNRLKQQALLSKSTAQRNVDQAEQELWELTGAQKPNLAQIQAKVEAIEKLRSEQRMSFIESVGAAAKLLTDEQRQILLGAMAHDADRAAAPAHQ